jgi:indolepyruvate ferredoxin oxidoreductase
VPEDDFTVRMPGVGGTGVVTASQILGMAATLDGRHVWGLDQTGLSQKAGPVVSDLRISREPVDGSNKVIAGQVDTYLVFDLLVGTGPVLDGSSPERTVAIVATTSTPTGQMVTDVHAAQLDDRLMRQLLDDRTRSAENIYVDAGRMVTRLFGSTTTANTFLLGVAHQRGALPLPARAIEEAIELNGAAVEANRLAFRWGRMLVVDPEQVEAAMISLVSGPTQPDATDIAMIGDLDRGPLGAVLRRRVSELRAYQNRAYARTYLDTVRRVAASEAALNPDSTELAETVAQNLYKFMAYKDEYEVARLLVDPGTLASARTAVGGRAKVSYNLHPPVLRAMGMKHKVRLGPWFTPVLRTLCVVRRLRGTPFDLFGLTRVRRLERDLIHEYRDLVEAAAEHLTPESYPRAVELARLPDMVRGYEHIKISNVERYRQEITRLTSAISLPV